MIKFFLIVCFALVSLSLSAQILETSRWRASVHYTDNFQLHYNQYSLGGDYLAVDGLRTGISVGNNFSDVVNYMGVNLNLLLYPQDFFWGANWRINPYLKGSCQWIRYHANPDKVNFYGGNVEDVRLTRYWDSWGVYFGVDVPLRKNIFLFAEYGFSRRYDFSAGLKINIDGWK